MEYVVKTNSEVNLKNNESTNTILFIKDNKNLNWKCSYGQYF